ncbi:hypothetical protein LCGC14_1092250 [marine sediment metagenome]|uniref:Uncharacterized protein n=1 Tax=marine sediment metagenome TaxID=412755 RepID=A0A0F9MZS5_9ZZZZ
MKPEEHIHKIIAKGKYKDKYHKWCESQTMEFFVWDNGTVSIKDNEDKDKPCFVLSDTNRRLLIKLLQKKE